MIRLSPTLFALAATLVTAAEPATVAPLPFQSDVAPGGNSITVRGEGETLVLLSYATGPETEKSFARIWKTLGDRFHRGHFPPDPTVIWHELFGQRRKSIENSP
jgi:hypothetical protein